MPEAPVLPPPAAPTPVLLYDGSCGFCDRTVQLILRADRHGHLRFAPLDGPTARAVVARHPELAGIDSLVFVEPGPGGAGEAVLVRSAAALRVARYLGGWWRLALVASILPKSLRDAAYDRFARNRHRWFGRLEACPVPPPGVRDRFLP